LTLAERVGEWLASTNASPSDTDEMLEAAGSARLREPTRMATVLKRPNVDVHALVEACGGGVFPDADPADLDETLTGAEMELRYSGYLERERERAEALRRQHGFALPPDLPYAELSSLSTEARQKLERVRPASLGQAAGIPGVSPSDLQNLMVEVRKRR
jgi:tRNA uridine 5-carboxymethylaminomethyl modification enzyme